MRSLLSPFVVVVVGALAAISVVGGCSTPNTGAANPSRGERFFQTRCNACHPGGGQGAGPPIDLAVAPDFLERGKTSGRHAVPEADWEPLMAHLQQRLGGGAVAAPTAVAGGAAPVAAAPVVAAAPAGDPAQGQPYFQNKCAKCHPGGNKIVGKTVPGVLQSGGSGKHGIPADQFDHVVAYLTTIGAVRAGGTPAIAAQPSAPVTAAPAIAAAPATASGDAAAGGSFFQTKCAKCHPGGNKITGKTVPGVLQAGGSGKHGVPAEHFDNLLAYLTTIGAVRAGSAPVAAAPTGGAATSSPAPTTTVPSSGVIPMNAGMVNCSCACQCPANTPQEAMPAACLCQCSCPR